jgi:hypothetical protein
MGWFDPPSIAVRKRVPEAVHGQLNSVEEYAQQMLSSVPAQNKPYLLGIVLSMWVKWNVVYGSFHMPPHHVAKMQAIYESCLKVTRGESYLAFHILADLAEQGAMPGVPESLFRDLAFQVSGTA